MNTKCIIQHQITDLQAPHFYIYMYIMYFDDVNIIKAPLGNWYAGQLSTTLCLDKYCIKTLKDILK